MDSQLILTIAAPIATAIGAYIIARRTTSGSVDTSDAATLWAESQAIRKELRDEIVALRADGAKLRTDILSLENDKVLDHAKILELVAKVKKLEARLKKLGGNL